MLLELYPWNSKGSQNYSSIKDFPLYLTIMTTYVSVSSSIGWNDNGQTVAPCNAITSTQIRQPCTVDIPTLQGGTDDTNRPAYVL